MINSNLLAKKENANPIKTPKAVPVIPIIAPWMKKIFLMVLGEAPYDNNIPISLVFWITSRISPAIMFRDATTIIRERVKNRTVFSRSSAVTMPRYVLSTK